MRVSTYRRGVLPVTAYPESVNGAPVLLVAVGHVDATGADHENLSLVAFPVQHNSNNKNSERNETKWNGTERNERREERLVINTMHVELTCKVPLYWSPPQNRHGINITPSLPPPEPPPPPHTPLIAGN